MGIQYLKWKLLPNLVLFLNFICYLQQLRMFFNDFFNLILVCKDIEPRYGKTRAKGFFSSVRVVSFTTCVLSINLLKHKIFKVDIFKNNFFQTNQFSVYFSPTWAYLEASISECVNSFKLKRCQALQDWFKVKKL